MADETVDNHSNGKNQEDRLQRPASVAGAKQGPAMGTRRRSNEGRDGRARARHELGPFWCFDGEGSSSRRVTTTAALSRMREPKTHMRAPAATWSLSWDHPKSRGAAAYAG